MKIGLRILLAVVLVLNCASAIRAEEAAGPLPAETAGVTETAAGTEETVPIETTAVAEAETVPSETAAGTAEAVPAETVAAETTEPVTVSETEETVPETMPQLLPEAPGPDTTAPVLCFIAADCTEVQAPGSFWLIAEVLEEGSGVEYGFAELTRNRPDAETISTESIPFQRNELTGTYEAFVELGPYVPDGELYLLRACFGDAAGNQMTYVNEDYGFPEGTPLPNAVTVKVANSDPDMADSQGPVLHSVAADRQKVQVPGSFQVTAELSDALSGVKFCTVSFAADPSGCQEGPVYSAKLQRNPDTGAYEGSIALQQCPAGGVLHLQYVHLCDRAGNETHYQSRLCPDTGRWEPLPNEVTVSVSNPGPEDRTGPVLKAVYLDRTEVELPGNVRVIVEAEDDRSGTERCTAEFTRAAAGEEISCSRSVFLQKDRTTGKFEGDLELGPYETSGKLYLASLQLEDGAGNQSDYVSTRYPGLEGLPLPSEVAVRLCNPGLGDNCLLLTEEELQGKDKLCVDGVFYPVQRSGTLSYLQLPEGCRSLVTYDDHVENETDVHTRYPISMQVWLLQKEGSQYRMCRAPELDNLLNYGGVSIRVRGKRGIRIITAMDKELRETLLEGRNGYTLVEYGTVLAWSSDLESGSDLVLGESTTRFNYAYRRGTADPVFLDTGSQIQYTNVLVDFGEDQCEMDMGLRPYAILETEDGTRFTVYGGIVYRSIGYVAYQIRNDFEPGSDAYRYVWDIIRSVYGSQYDGEYQE